MRPLFYDFPEDSICWETERQYMYGPNIMVVPVMESGMSKIKVYLPKGAKWTNVWTKEEYEGGRTVEVETPLDKMPLFVRDGFVLDVCE